MFGLSESTIDKIALAMTASVTNRLDLESPSIEVWQTYIGQMISHDIVPVTNILSVRRKVSFALNLDSLYGSFNYSSLMFNPSSCVFIDQDGYFDIDNRNANDFLGTDLPRTDDGIAKIPEHRNDENLIIAQLHALWLRFHNSLLRKGIAADAFEAKKLVTLVFQLVVIEDFLASILTRNVHDIYFKENNSFELDWDKKQIPDFFGLAAFRFGHSMIRELYTIRLLKGVNIEEILAKNQKIAPDLFINWNKFILNNNERAMKIDTYIASGMSNIKTKIGPINIAKKNILAGLTAGLNSGGYFYEQFCKKNNCLYDFDRIKLEAIDNFDNASFGNINELNFRNLPLWLYVLMEAQSESESSVRGCLGSLGSVLVADVLSNAIKNSNISVYQNDVYCFSNVVSQMGLLGELIQDAMNDYKADKIFSMINVLNLIKKVEEYDEHSN